MTARNIARWSRVFLAMATLTIALEVNGATGTATAPAPVARGTPRHEQAAAAGTAARLWRQIDAQAAQLQQSIAKNALANVHHQAFALRDLVSQLANNSPGLTPDRLAKVRRDAGFVATLAARLDASGDARDQIGTRQNYEKLTAVLKSLRGSYAR